MDPRQAVLGLLLAAPVVALGVLTAVGARRRGDPLVRALVSGLGFPVTWVVWYLHDAPPAARRARRAAAGRR